MPLAPAALVLTLGSLLAIAPVGGVSPALGHAGVAAEPDSGFRIVGGDEVPEGGWPSVVAIVVGDLNGPQQQLCTGTVVSDRLVLTAAHCFNGVTNPEHVLVLFGNDIAVAAQSEASYTFAESFGAHPDYCGDLTIDCWDIGYVVLPTPVGVGEPIVPLATQTEVDEALELGAPLTVVGFGQDDDAVSGIKREVGTQVNDHSPAGFEFMAGGGGMDSCLGDSGGPAFAQLADGSWRHVGIVSRGSEDCGQGGIYGNPLPALCWVRDDSGIDVVPEGCGNCDCVELPKQRPSDDKGCRLTDSSGQTRVWGLFVLGFGALIRRRRRLRSRP